MADKTTRLIVDALTRAAAEPAGLPLFAGRGKTGLFPANAAARAAARRCQDDGLIRTDGPHAAVTDTGLHWLVSQSSPRQVLEDFLRILEQKQAQTADLIAAARHMADGLVGLRDVIERLNCGFRISDCGSNGHHVSPQSVPTRRENPQSAIIELLDQWHATSNGDCPLPELYHRLSAKHSGLSIGCFHDLLRELHDAGRLYLHPWTGPLYDLPEPPYALLIGHEIAYYASPRPDAVRSAECGMRNENRSSTPHSALRTPHSKEGS